MGASSKTHAAPERDQPKLVPRIGSSLELAQRRARSPLPSSRTEASTTSTRTAGLLDDSARNPFLATLHSAVLAAAETELAGTGWTAENCPYLEYWFAYYEGRSATQIEAALHKYAPSTANAASVDDYIGPVVERVRVAIARWRATGDIDAPELANPEVAESVARIGVPDPIDTSARSRFERAVGVARAKSEATPKSENCGCGTCDKCKGEKAPMSELGEGQRLDSSVRARMERAFGRSFANVNVHAGSAGNAFARQQSAHAVAFGEQIAFAPGTYRPGTLVGDLLIAHELAHVSQQAGATDLASGEARGLEHQADRAALLAMVGGNSRGQITPTGLRMQRCAAAAVPAAEVGAEVLGAEVIGGTAAGAGGAGLWSTLLGTAGIGGILTLESDTPKVDDDPCSIALVACLESKGYRQALPDCGACFRECRHAGGVWPYYKCP